MPKVLSPCDKFTSYFCFDGEGPVGIFKGTSKRGGPSAGLKFLTIDNMHPFFAFPKIQIANVILILSLSSVWNSASRISFSKSLPNMLPIAEFLTRFAPIPFSISNMPSSE